MIDFAFGTCLLHSIEEAIENVSLLHGSMGKWNATNTNYTNKGQLSSKRMEPPARGGKKALASIPGAEQNPNVGVIASPIM